jgi:hypothetical protein
MGAAPAGSLCAARVRPASRRTRLRNPPAHRRALYRQARGAHPRGCDRPRHHARNAGANAITHVKDLRVGRTRGEPWDPRRRADCNTSLIDGEEEIIEERSVILAAAHEPDATGWERSPGRLVPELVYAGWTLIEDAPDSRNWAGVIDGDAFARFAAALGLENRRGEVTLGMTGEHGDLAGHSYVFDGLEWGSGGSSPVVWMRLTGQRAREEADAATERGRSEVIDLTRVTYASVRRATI